MTDLWYLHVCFLISYFWQCKVPPQQYLHGITYNTLPLHLCLHISAVGLGILRDVKYILVMVCGCSKDVNGTRFSRVPKKIPVPGKKNFPIGRISGNCNNQISFGFRSRFACVTRNRRRQPWRTRLCPGQEGRRTHMMTACEMTGE